MAKERIEVEIVEEEEEERDAEPITDDEIEDDDEGVSEEEEDVDEDVDEDSETSTDDDDGDDEDEGGEEEDSKESEHIMVSIGEDPDDEHTPAPQWVKDLRKQRRIDAKRIKELEKQITDNQSPRQQVLGEKPTLESSNYDAEAYEKELATWFTKKREIETEQERVATTKAKLQEEQNARYKKYDTDKMALKVPDFDEAEEVVIETLSETQQGAILQGSADPALLVYALGKNEEHARKLAKIEDPVKFIFALAKLEAQLKVSKSRSKPKPEKKVGGSGRSSNAIDSTLERLRKEAEKTGDYTKVIAHKNKHRSKV